MTDNRIAATPQPTIPAGGDNRAALTLALAPLAALMALCLLSLLQRAVEGSTPGPTFGGLSRRDAQRIAGDVCRQLTGSDATPRQATFQSPTPCAGAAPCASGTWSAARPRAASTCCASTPTPAVSTP